MRINLGYYRLKIRVAIMSWKNKQTNKNSIKKPSGTFCLSMHHIYTFLLKSTSLSPRGGLVMQLGMKQMYSGQPKSGPPGWGLAKG